MQTYSIRRGDTLGTVSRQFNVPVETLAQANNIEDVNRIQVGQRLVIPDGFDAPRDGTPAPRTSDGDSFEAGSAPAASSGQVRDNSGREFPTSADGTPLFRQGDAEWGRRGLGTGGNTVSSAGCAMAATAMAMSKITGEVITPGELDAHLDSNNGYQGDNLRWGVAAGMRGLGMGAQPWNLNTINQQIDAGRPVVVGVDYRGSPGTDHWITVTGRGRDPNGQAFYRANDPATGREITLHERNGQLVGGPQNYRTTGELRVMTGGNPRPGTEAPQPPATASTGDSGGTGARGTRGATRTRGNPPPANTGTRGSRGTRDATGPRGHQQSANVAGGTGNTRDTSGTRAPRSNQRPANAAEGTLNTRDPQGTRAPRSNQRPANAAEGTLNTRDPQGTRAPRGHQQPTNAAEGTRNTRDTQGTQGTQPPANAAGPTSLEGLSLPSGTLRRDDRGADVELLQRALVQGGYLSQAQMDTGPGIFGRRTEGALMQFQRANGLTDDGVYGPDTRGAMERLGGRVSEAPAPAPAPAPGGTGSTGGTGGTGGTGSTGGAAPVTGPLPSTGDPFLDRVAADAILSQRETGVPASVTLAQALLESGRGESDLATEANNFFGIKGEGPAGHITMRTREVINGQEVFVDADFRRYHSPAESFADHGRFLLEYERYDRAFQYTDDAEQFAREIHAAGYATDPEYSNLLIDIIHQYDLERFDAIARGQ